MSGGPPFERYPGPPRRDGASFRVISPWRDALAWVSIAGRLAVTSYLLRTPGGWTEVLPETGDTATPEPLWAFAGRDPVELVFRTIAVPGIAASVTASVTVSGQACEMWLTPPIDEATIPRLIALPPTATLQASPDGTVIQIVSIKPVIPSP